MSFIDVKKVEFKELQLFYFYPGWELIEDIICYSNLIQVQIL